MLIAVQRLAGSYGRMGAARRLWLLLPQEPRQAAFRAAVQFPRRFAEVAEFVSLRATERRPGPAVGGDGACALIGLFSTPCGLGRAAWLTALGLQQAGYRVELMDWDPTARRLSPFRTLAALNGPAAGPDLLVVHLNPPESTSALKAFSRTDKRRRRKVAFWVWETERAPWSWRLHALFFSELWTPSRFSATAMRRCHGTIHVVPHPCALDRTSQAPGQRAARVRLGIGRSEFVVAFSFDMRSGFERKNPLGLVEAFRRAFPHPAQHPGKARLVIRVTGRAHAPDLFARLADEGRRTSLTLLDDDVDVHTLYAACDVYASLHRAEGFGLTLAEAMLSGKPALASDWSGNLEFMSHETSVLTPCRLTPVRDPQEIYPARDRWADPDMDAAAAGLRRLGEDVGLRTSLGEKGRRQAMARLSRLDVVAEASSSALEAFG